MSKKNTPIPVFDSPIIETHCHLDYLKQDDPAGIVERAQSVGVETLITIAVSPDNLSAVREMVAAIDVVYGTQGIHPHDARLFNAEVDGEICAHLDDPKIVAVGEIGLDYHYDNSPRDVQRDVFSRQLEMAAESGLPVVIHSRDADEDTIAILAEHVDAMANKGVIHSFTSGPELAEYCLGVGFCLGFNGIITFNAAENVRDIVRMTPLDQLLLETDSPFLTPVPYRGRENAPFYIPFVAQKVADLLDTPVEDVINQTTSNARRVFALEPASSNA